MSLWKVRIGIQGPASPVKKCFVSLTQYDTWWELAPTGHRIPMSVAKPAAGGQQQQEDAWVAVIEPALWKRANGVAAVLARLAEMAAGGDGDGDGAAAAAAAAATAAAPPPVLVCLSVEDGAGRAHDPIAALAALRAQGIAAAPIAPFAEAWLRRMSTEGVLVYAPGQSGFAVRVGFGARIDEAEEAAARQAMAHCGGGTTGLAAALTSAARLAATPAATTVVLPACRAVDMLPPAALPDGGAAEGGSGGAAAAEAADDDDDDTSAACQGTRRAQALGFEHPNAPPSRLSDFECLAFRSHVATAQQALSRLVASGALSGKLKLAHKMPLLPGDGGDGGGGGGSGGGGGGPKSPTCGPAVTVGAGDELGPGIWFLVISTTGGAKPRWTPVAAGAGGNNKQLASMQFGDLRSKNRKAQ